MAASISQGYGQEPVQNVELCALRAISSTLARLRITALSTRIARKPGAAAAFGLIADGSGSFAHAIASTSNGHFQLLDIGQPPQVMPVTFRCSACMVNSVDGLKH
jgi:hypothetical protein